MNGKTERSTNSPLATLFVVCIVFIFASGLGYWRGTSEHWTDDETAPGDFKPFDHRTFRRALLADAPGCVIKMPNGQVINKAFSVDPNGNFDIPAGTTITIDCFPIWSTERSFSAESRENKLKELEYQKAQLTLQQERLKREQ